MTDKERLENIKEKYSEVTVLEYINDIEIVGVDMKDLVWLIKQAERIEELEKEVEKQKNRKYIKMRQRDDFMKKAQRYKQALEFYADSKNWIPQNDDVLSEITMDYGSKARQALEVTEK